MNSSETGLPEHQVVEKFPCSFLNLLKLILFYIIISISVAIVLLIAQEIIEALFFSKGENFKLIESGVGAIIIGLLSFLALVHYVGTQQNRSWEDIFRFKRVTPNLLFSLLPLILGTVILCSEIDNLLRYFFDLPDFFTTVLLDLSKDPITGFILVVLIAPFTEEIIFRGIILEGFISKYSQWRAILLSAIIFSIWHLNPVQFSVAFLFGLISGYIYVNTLSLIPCIMFHAIGNCLGFMSRYLPPDIPGVTSDPLGEAQFQPIWLDILGVFLFLIGLWILYRVINKHQNLNLKTRQFETYSAKIKKHNLSLNSEG